MNKRLGCLLLAGGMLALGSTAQAQPYYGYGYNRGAGLAIGAVIGLGLGLAAGSLVQPGYAASGYAPGFGGGYAPYGGGYAPYGGGYAPYGGGYAPYGGVGSPAAVGRDIYGRTIYRSVIGFGAYPRY